MLGVLFAEQLAVVEPAHVQLHGPEPLTAEAVPAAHKLVVGAVATVVPLAEPHAPAGAHAAFAYEHVPEFEPPPEPWQTHWRVVPHAV